MDNEKKPRKPQEQSGLFIPNRQLSVFVAGALSLMFFVFIGGYFLGKNYLIEPFVAKVEQDSFADQIYASLCTLYDQDMSQLTAQAEEPDDAPAIETAVVQFDHATEAEPIAIAEDEKITEPEQKNSELVSVQEVKESWYAQLIGYGKEQSAVAFADKLQKKGIPVRVKTRISTTPKGQKRRWYQVITQSNSDRDALQTIVNKITHEEKLKDVQIRAC